MPSSQLSDDDSVGRTSTNASSEHTSVHPTLHRRTAQPDADIATAQEPALVREPYRVRVAALQPAVSARSHDATLHQESASSVTTASTRAAKRHAWRLWLYVLPFLMLSVLFCYIPLFGWIYAFYDYQPPIPLSESEFVGLQWFQMLVQNPAQLRMIGQVLLNTFAMSSLNIVTSFLPVIFAIMLNEIRVRWFKNLIQTLTTLPNFISWVLVYSIAFAMFSSTGLINDILQQLHLISAPIQFLDSADHVWLKMLLWGMWKGLGWGSIMYLAGIAGIDPELYEAAQVDGANRFQQIIHVTIPQLMPTYFVLLMLSISNFLNNGMDQYYVFQNAFNQKWIQVLDLYVYNVGMGQNSLSLGTAISMLKSLVSVGLLLLVNWLSKRSRGVGIV